MKLTPSFPCSEPSMMPQNPQQQAQAPQELRHELASLASCTLAPLPSLALFVFGPLPTVLPARSSLFPHCRWPLAFLSETFLESVCLFGLVGSTATSHLPTILSLLPGLLPSLQSGPHSSWGAISNANETMLLLSSSLPWLPTTPRMPSTLPDPALRAPPALPLAGPTSASLPQPDLTLPLCEPVCAPTKGQLYPGALDPSIVSPPPAPGL